MSLIETVNNLLVTFLLSVPTKGKKGPPNLAHEFHPSHKNGTPLIVSFDFYTHYSQLGLNESKKKYYFCFSLFHKIHTLKHIDFRITATNYSAEQNEEDM